MKTWEDKHVFHYPWEVVAEAAYRKYPNPQNPNVKALDVLERRVEGEKGRRRLFSHRLFTTLWNVPLIVLQIVGTNPTMYIHEQSVCDADSKSLTIAARNLALRNLFRMDELLEYSVHPDNPSLTVLRQSATMDVFGIPLLGGLLESLLISSYSSTVSKGREAVENKAREVLLEQSTGKQ